MSERRFDLNRKHADVLCRHILEYRLIPQGVVPAEPFSSPPTPVEFAGVGLALQRLKDWADREPWHAVSLVVGAHRVMEMYGIDPDAFRRPPPQWMTLTWLAAYVHEVARLSPEREEALDLVETAFVEARIKLFPRLLAALGPEAPKRLGEELPGAIWVALHDEEVSDAHDLGQLWDAVRTLAVRKITQDAPHDQPLQEDIPGHAPDVEEQIVGRNDEQTVARLGALSSCTKQERAVLFHRFVMDMSEAETAAALGVSLGSVKQAVWRARQRISRAS